MLRKSLTLVALLFVAAMVVNTLIALHYRWPAMFDAPGDPETIATDFIWYGTRISPPIPGLLVFTLSALAVLYAGWRGVAGTLVIMAVSTLIIIAGAGEPAGLPENAVPRWAWQILGMIGGYAPFIIILLGGPRNSSGGSAAGDGRRGLARLRPGRAACSFQCRRWLRSRLQRRADAIHGVSGVPRQGRQFLPAMCSDQAEACAG